MAEVRVKICVQSGFVCINDAIFVAASASIGAPDLILYKKLRFSSQTEAKTCTDRGSITGMMSTLYIYFRGGILRPPDDVFTPGMPFVLALARPVLWSWLGKSSSFCPVFPFISVVVFVTISSTKTCV
jgi:hypothetical protein